MKKYFSYIVLILIYSHAIFADNQQEIKIVTAKSGLNMRGEPNVNGVKIVTIPFNAKIVIIKKESAKIKIGDSEGSWVKVKYEEKEGWVFDAYLDNPTEQSDNDLSLDKIANEMKGGACLPCPACDKNTKCDLSPSAPCYEGVKLYPNGKSISGSCDVGHDGTWKLEGDKIIITNVVNKKSDCISYCEMESFDPNPQKKSEKKNKCIIANKCDQLKDGLPNQIIYQVEKQSNTYYINKIKLSFPQSK